MESDRFAIRAVVVVLGTVVLIVSAGQVLLAFLEIAVPDSLDRLGFTALGAVGAVLSKTSSSPTSDELPTPVVVVDEPDDDPPLPPPG